MNESRFRQLLEQLEESVWQALADGQALLLVDDRYLQPGPVTAPNAIVTPAESPTMDLVGLRRNTLAQVEELLYAYYRTHPLTRVGFDHQVEALIEHHGAMAFAAPPGRLPQRTLFVDGGELLAEGPDSPRHRYGAYCELSGPVADDRVEESVRRWLDSGEAHERYLGMNVCRYNC